MSDVVSNILLVEDHPGDVRLTRRALAKLPYQTDLHVALDGYEAMEFLLRQGKFSSAPRPHLVLLDLNMPRMDGRQVLREVGQNPSLKTIPVVVLTTSSADTDVTEAYRLCANSYHAKPVSFPDFVSLLDDILKYWISVARTPS